MPRPSAPPAGSYGEPRKGTMNAYPAIDVEDASAAFERAGLEHARAEADRLLEVLAADPGASGEAVDIDLEALARERKRGTPLEYAVGLGAFMGRAFTCTPAALIPRAETELLARTALELTRGAATLVDVGTGSGNLAVTLALELPAARVYACDISEAAVDLARANIRRHGVDDRVFPRVGDLFGALDGLGLEGAVDLVVCNPPYIPSASLEKLPPQVRDSEPREAFDGGAFGLEIFRRLIREAPRFLRPGGSLAFEIGAGQERLVGRLVAGATAFGPAVEHRDEEGRVRVISLERSGAV